MYPFLKKFTLFAFSFLSPFGVNATESSFGANENALSPNSTLNVEGTLSLHSKATVSVLQGIAKTASINLGDNPENTLTFTGLGEKSCFSGKIEGKGGISIQENAILISKGPSSYSGPTKVDGGLSVKGDGYLSPHSPFEINGTLDLNDYSNEISSLTGEGVIDLGYSSSTVLTVRGGEFAGHIIGSGGLNIDTDSSFTLSEDNNFTGGTKISRGQLILQGRGTLLPYGKVHLENGAILDISQMNFFTQTMGDLSGGSSTSFVNLGDKELIVHSKNPTTFAGRLKGNGGRFVKVGPNALTLIGDTSSRKITIEVAEGLLVTNSRYLRGIAQVNKEGKLALQENDSSTFTGHLIGNGEVVKMGKGELNYLKGVDAFTGLTTVHEGTLALNTLLGGHMHVQNSGVLKGTGQLQGNLTLNNGGKVIPGNSIGSLTVSGNYIQNSGSVFVTQIDQRGHSSSLHVDGSVFLNGGDVKIVSLDGRYQINHPYFLLHADKGVKNHLDNIIPSSNLYKAKFLNQKNDLFFVLESTLVNGARTSNQRGVARQLDILSAANPDPAQATLINELISQSIDVTAQTLQDLTGQQHTADFFAADVVNRSFLRRLYDPIRDLVSIYTCEECPCCDEWTTWIEGGGGSSYLDTTSTAYGLKMHGGQLTAGVQKMFVDDLTFGAALSYEHQSLRYKQGGIGRMNDILFGLYTLYRPECFYVFADTTYGYFHNKICREVGLPLSTLHLSSHSDLNQFTLYAEGGYDFVFCPVLIQPFVGFETGGVWRNGVRERGDADYALHSRSKGEGTFYSRLGVHVTSLPVLCDFTVSLDAAWQSRWTSNRSFLEESFAGFGSTFCVEGVTVNRNSFQGAATVLYAIDPMWTLFTEASGEVWGNASTYDVSIGLIANW